MDAGKLKTKYNEIWETVNDIEIKEILKRGFMFQCDDEILNPDVLFIGINPSYKDGDPEERKHYTMNESETLPYFQSFHKIADELKTKSGRDITWTHLDLLVFRETNQKYIETNLFQKREGLDFIMAQLKIAKERIEHIQPKVIVVSNALARRLMGKDQSADGKHNVWMDFKFNFDNEIGTDKIIESSVFPNTYVFFTSMLSGQRALDNGSRERLIWHIRKCLEAIHSSASES
jgi:hypothetical protein